MPPRLRKQKISPRKLGWVRAAILAGLIGTSSTLAHQIQTLRSRSIIPTRTPVTAPHSHAEPRVIPRKIIMPETHAKQIEHEHVAKPKQKIEPKPPPKKIETKEYKLKIPFPEKALVPRGMEKADSWCTRFARLGAWEWFGMNYNGADAWNFAKANKSVWRKGTDKRNYLDALKPGYILGVWHPTKRNEKHSPYTHGMLYFGKDPKTGQHMVMHEWGKTRYLETLNHAIKSKHMTIMEVIAPKEE